MFIFILLKNQNNRGSTHEKDHSFLVTPPTVEAKDKWISILSKVIQNLEVLRGKKKRREEKWWFVINDYFISVWFITK